MKRYIVWFDFPYGRTYLKGSFIDDSNYDRNVEIPEFTQDYLVAKEFNSKTYAENQAKFYAGKYAYGVVEV